jgi:hypothetical protein
MKIRTRGWLAASAQRVVRLLCDSRVSGTICSPFLGAYVGGTAIQSERMRTARGMAELSLGMPRHAQVLRRAESTGIDLLQGRNI